MPEYWIPRSCQPNRSECKHPGLHGSTIWDSPSADNSVDYDAFCRSDSFETFPKRKYEEKCRHPDKVQDLFASIRESIKELLSFLRFLFYITSSLFSIYYISVH